MSALQKSDLREKYEGYDWIKVPRWQHDSAKTVEENYAILQAHHVNEATFLVEEIRKLAAFADHEINFLLGMEPEIEKDLQKETPC